MSPSSSHTSISGRLLRNAGENWFCTLTSASPSTDLPSRIWSGFAFDRPTISTLPESAISLSVSITAAYSTFGSGRWCCQRAIRLDAEPAQAVVDGLLEVVAAAVEVPPPVVAEAHVPALGREQHAVADPELVEQAGDQGLVGTLRLGAELVTGP